MCCSMAFALERVYTCMLLWLSACTADAMAGHAMPLHTPHEQCPNAQDVGCPNLLCMKVTTRSFCGAFDAVCCTEGH